MADKIQFRRDTAANWASVNPILSQGEMGINLNTSQFKIGDGILAWNSLAYGGMVGPDGPGPIYFGDGSDGPLTLTNAVLTLNRDYYLTDYTPVGNSYIDCNGWRLFIKGTWNTTLATSANTIRCLQNNGQPAAAQAGAAGGLAVLAQTLGASTAGGAGAGVAMVYVNQITTSVATIAPQLSVHAGNGGLGANGIAGNVGGGGGGAGGGGGFIYCVYGSRSGTAVTGFFEASGGDGGNGGSGFGTGVFGNGGGSGAGGTIIAINATTGVSTVVINNLPSIVNTGQIGGIATPVLAAI